MWAPIPEEYNRLAAYAIRESSPSSDYMSFLNSQLLLTGSKNTNFVSEKSFNKFYFYFYFLSILFVYIRNDNSLNAPLEKNLHSVSAPPSTNITPNFNHDEKESFLNRSKVIQQHSIAVMNSENFYNSPSTSSATPSSSSSAGPRRRNALNADEHYELIAETSQRRQKKSVGKCN